MVMSRQERNQRRALIVRRWAAYRAGQAQREISRERQEALGENLDESVVEDDLFAELPDGLTG